MGRSVKEYYDYEIETMSRNRLDDIQSDLFRKICLHAYQNSRFYKDKWSGQGIGQSGLSKDKIKRIPFCTKQDLVDNFPYGLCAVPRENLVNMHLTSGSSGNPVAFFQTGQDIEKTVNTRVRSLFMRGLRKGDVLQNTLAYGLWSAGLSIHLAGERLGCMVIPSGPGNTKRQIWLIQAMQTTVLCAVPSYHLRIAEVGESMGIDFSSLRLRIGLSVAGRLDEPMRKEIEERLGLDLRNVYGSTEAGGVASECDYRQGLHSWQDAMLLEIIDPVSGEELPPGERGELVVTNLQNYGMPLIRYRTRDMTSILVDEDCPCGRTHVKISGDIERVDDVVKIKGVLVSPRAIEKHLKAFPELSGEFLIRVRTGSVKSPELFCELRPSVDIAFQEEVEKSVTSEIKNKIGLNFHTSLVPSGALPSERPGKRIEIIPR